MFGSRARREAEAERFLAYDTEVEIHKGYYRSAVMKERWRQELEFAKLEGDDELLVWGTPHKNTWEVAHEAWIDANVSLQQGDVHRAAAQVAGIMAMYRSTDLHGIFNSKYAGRNFERIPETPNYFDPDKEPIPVTVG